MELVVLFRDSLCIPSYVRPWFIPYVGCGKEEVPKQDYGTSGTSQFPLQGRKWIRFQQNTVVFSILNK